MVAPLLNENVIQVKIKDCLGKTVSGLTKSVSMKSLNEFQYLTVFTDGYKRHWSDSVDLHMSRSMRKLTKWFPNRSDTNQAVHAQKIARGLKFWIY